jgi:hypothetical protein
MGTIMKATSILSCVAFALLAQCSGMPRLIDEDASVDEDAGVDVLLEPETPPEPECEPEEEVCDGEDNDCDGEVDEDIPPEPCEESGSRRCVMGRWSECPPVCTGCVPGTVRQCFEAYCTGWGVQTCNDGGYWNTCQEAAVPGNCDDGFGWVDSVASTGQCCIDEGFCCQDYWDLDGDGDTDDSVGTCYGIDCRE